MDSADQKDLFRHFGGICKFMSAIKNGTKTLVWMSGANLTLVYSYASWEERR